MGYKVNNEDEIQKANDELKRKMKEYGFEIVLNFDDDEENIDDEKIAEK